VKRQTLGRAEDCDVRVVHTTVSRRHAEVWRHGNSLYIRDLGSRNGTFVDGMRVTESPIQVGCDIQIGQVPLNVVNSIDGDDCTGEDETALVSKSPDAWQEMLTSLSPGQVQVVTLLLRGLGEKEVAERLCLSRHTVHTHVKQIYRVLDVQSRSQLLAKYLMGKE
jgi:pSer/pThr/pTyr-binding forkhead associated (FHA) protein